MPKARASGRGNMPIVRSSSQATAYSIRCFTFVTVSGARKNGQPARSRACGRLPFSSANLFAGDQAQPSRLLAFGDNKIFCDLRGEWNSICRRCDLPGQNRLERDISSVEVAGDAMVLADHVAVEADSRKRSLGARIGQDLDIELPVGAGLRVPAYWTGRRRGICANLEFAAQQVFHAFLIHDDHDQVDAFTADLQSEAAAADAKKCRRAPSLAGAAGCDALSVFTTEDESRLEQGGNHGNASRVAGDLFRNPLIRGVHNFLNNLTS